ncbi:hypothetical protein [Paenibacillus sp. sgz5001063]|uniref:hypothetical protein n=1 Tax=Paenibacillus sp. sgz5001063 TaxID=3242474 RepID=UPI0036D374DD
MKTRNIIRVAFAAMLLLLDLGIALKYTGLERRVLLIELTGDIVVSYLLLVEYTLVVKSKWTLQGTFWKRMFIYVFTLFAYLFLLITSNNTYQLSVDAFVKGYSTEEVTVVERLSEYRGSDKVKVEIDGEQHTYTLPPSYTEVRPKQSYQVHIFHKSKLLVAVKPISN